jgi:hypothetical protein
MDTKINESIFQNELYLNRIGSTWLTDSLYLFFILPLLIIGVILNSLSFYILLQIDSKKAPTRVFDYLRVYSLNSAFIAFMTLFSIYSYAPRYLIAANYYMARVLRCRIIFFMVMSLLNFGSLLDIIIGLDRLSILIGKFEFIRRKSYIAICFISLIVSAMFNISSFFTKIQTQDELLNDMKNLKTLSHCPMDENFRNITGTVITAVSYLLKNVFTLIIEITVNIYCIISFKKFIRIKFGLVKNGSAHLKSQFISEKKNLIMFIYLSAMTIFINFFVLLSSGLYYFFNEKPEISYFFVWVSFLFYSIKYISNIFVFYFCNKLFKEKFLNFATEKIKKKRTNCEFLSF